MGLTIEYRDIIIMLHNIMDNFRLLSEEKNINFSLQQRCLLFFCG